jgi:ABC-2 type transport system permease protein
MTAKKRSQKYLRFTIYLVVVVLINIVGISLFFRWDLTKNKVYSLSEVSKTVVSTLTEPMTIKVFFTRDLKAPYNNIERYLRDLLEEYAIYGNRFFNYQFFDVSPQSEGIGSSENQQLASSYGIQPVQIQTLEEDQLMVKRAYMGLVIIHGDIVERIPTITSTDGLEYTLTTTFQRVNNKISALLGLTDNIRVQLLLSDSLKTVAPLMGLDTLPDIPETVESIINKLNQKNYNRLTYSFQNPATDEQQETATRTYNVMHLKWPEIEKDNVAAGSGVIGLVMSYGDKTVTLPILQVLRIPIIGTQYQLASPEEIEEMINAEVETLVDINESIGYLADHGTLSFGAGMGMMPGQQDPAGTLSTFSELVGKTYSPRQFSLSEESVPRDVQSIIVARPTEPFTDFELFQLDQALMRGQNLILFLDPFKEVPSQQMDPMGYQSQPPTYVPVDSGLEKLLAHWGVSVTPSIVMDKNCYEQNLSRNMGGGKQPLYFAPILKSENINHSLPMTRNIKELVVLKASPLVLNDNVLGENNLKATVVLSSSDEAWEMNAPINLNPMYHSPPGPEEMEKKTLACTIEGRFPSYFAGKPIPEKAQADDGSEDTDADSGEAPDGDTVTPDPVMSRVESEGGRLDTGRSAKIFLMGSGEMLKDNLVDAEGKTPNGMLVMNVIDALNQHDDVAMMRNKTQRHNPLDETSVTAKTTIKAINIAGLPVLVVLFGLLVWMRRHARKNSIRRMFETE